MKAKAHVLSICGLSIIVMLFQNCGSGLQTVAVEDGQIFSVDTSYSKAAKKCQFLDSDSLRNILKDVFQISQGDVAMRDSAGRNLRARTCGSNPNQVQNCFYIADNQSTLGAANLADGTPEDLSCSATKYKLAAEIFIHACQQVKTNNQVRESLFPNGSNDFNPIYLKLIGRKPTLREVEVLRALVRGVTTQNAEIAVCAVVSSSVEALSRI